MTIRQEINIIDAIAGTASGIVLTDWGYVQLDTTQFVNPTYYFEVVVSTSAAASTVTLRRKGTTTDDASTTTTSTGRIRSSSFSPPAGKTEYGVFSSNASVRIKSARIIILDDVGSAITTSETQIEIGNRETGKTNTASAALTNPKYWKYTAANWDGYNTFYAEVTSLTSAGNTRTIKLQEDDGSFGGWADKVTIVSAASSTAAVRTRSAAFTPVDGRHYRIVGLSSTTKSSYSIYNAKIIVDTINAVDVANITSIGNSYPVEGGTAGSSQTFQAIGQSFTASSSYSLSSVDMFFFKLGSPADNLVMEVLTGSITGTVVATSNNLAASSVLASPGGWVTFVFATPPALTSSTKYYLRVTRSGARDASNFCASASSASSVYPDGGAYSRDNNVWSAESSTIDLGFRTHSTTGFTLLEPQYLLLNTADIGTGLQGYQTLIDTSDWSGVSIAAEHAMDSNNASNSTKLQDIDNGNADITSSAVTGANQQISSDIWANFTSGHQVDANVTDSTGTVAASRIIIQVSPAAAATAHLLASQGVGT